MNTKNILKERKKEKGVTVIEIFILILSTIAFSYILASSIPTVSAGGTGQCVNSLGTTWQLNSDGSISIVGGSMEVFLI